MSDLDFVVPFAPEETSRIQKLCARLSPRSSVRESAQALLNGTQPTMTQLEECLAVLRGSSASRWRERAVAAWVLGAASLPEDLQAHAAEMAARTLDNFDLQRDSWGRIRRAIAFGLPTGFIAFLFSWRMLDSFVQRWYFSVPQAGTGLIAFVAIAAGAILTAAGVSAGGYLSLLLDHRRVTATRLEAARSLARMRAPELLGAIARGMSDHHAAVRAESLRAFHATLPAITEEMEGRLPRGLGAHLCGILRSAEPALIASILPVLPVVAGGEAIPTVERLAKKAKTEELRTLAEATLVPLYAKRERARQSDVLLRPTETADAETLLRPSWETLKQDPELLLRPTAGENIE